MFVDRFHEQALDLRDGKDFFRKSIKLGFSQNLCQRSDAFNGCAKGDKVMRPLAPISFFEVGDTVFMLLLSVPELGKLALIVSDLGFQFEDGFLPTDKR